MKKGLLTKRYWLRVLKLFIVLLPLYFLVQFIGEDKKEFWSLSHLSSGIATALLMSAAFAYSAKPLTENSHNETYASMKPTWKQFLIGYLVFTIIGLILMTLLLMAGWALLYVLSDNSDPFWPVFVKAIATTLVMCFFINGVFFLDNRSKYKRWKKNNSLTNS